MDQDTSNPARTGGEGVPESPEIPAAPGPVTPDGFVAESPAEGERISRERISSLSIKLAGRYRFGRQVGAGPESIVYHAVDNGSGESVAIKIVDLPEDAMVAGALAAEARLAAGVDHPLVGKIVGFEFDENDAYFISRFIEGSSLQEMAQSQGSLPFDAVRRIGQDVAEAVNAIHGLCLLHRNIKSSNVIVRPDGGAVITDLGVGRPTGAPGRLSLACAPAYTAPEVFEGFADERSDSFSIGACLFEALTGRPPPMGYVNPPDGLGPDPLLHRPDAPEDLVAVTRECLAREAARRPRSAASIATRLGRPVSEPGSDAAATSTWKQALQILLVLGAGALAASLLFYRYAKWYPELVDRFLPGLAGFFEK